MKILHRMIFMELAKVFLPSLLGITGIIVLAGVFTEATQRGLGPGQVLAALPLIVPSLLPFIIPPTTLFASCIVYGRLAHDNEITAIKSAGTNVVFVVWPGIVLGLVTSLTTLGLYYHLIPHTQHLLRNVVVKDVEEFLYALLKKDHEIRPRPDIRLNYEMTVQSVQGKRLKNPTFMRRDATGKSDVVAVANEAELHVDLMRGEVVVRMMHGRVIDPAGKAHAQFDEQSWTVPLPTMDKSQRFSSREMTWQEVLQRREELSADVIQKKQVIDQVIGQFGPMPAQPDTASYLKNLQYAYNEQLHRIHILEAELQMRPALSFGCLFFVLVGCPVGIWFSKSDYLSAFITCFLPIAFIYYPIQLCFTNFAKDGKVPAYVALWVANAVVGVVAIGLFRKMLKH